MYKKNLEMDVSKKRVIYFSCSDTPTDEHTQQTWAACISTEWAQIQTSTKQDPEQGQTDAGWWSSQGTEPQGTD